jgi:pimeloyl-ACP methyl ester carboxylesterase
MHEVLCLNTGHIRKLLTIYILLIFVPCYGQGVPSRPVVFIPGILGSKLCTNDGKHRLLWGDAGSYNNIQSLKLPLKSPEKDSSIVSCGVIEAVKIVGPLKIHQYDHLVQSLESLGYERDKTLFLFHYDWRQSNSETAKRLREFIDKKIPEGHFDIVAHSMGGIVGRLYLEQLDLNARVDRFITLGTPYRGSVETLRFADSGWSWWKNALAGGIQDLRSTFFTFPSIFQLLPSYNGCCFQSPPGGNSDARINFDPFAVSFWTQVESLPDEYRTQIGIESLTQKLDEARTVRNLLLREFSPKVEFVPIVSGIVPTVWRTYLDTKTGRFLQWDTSYGDGTVYELSAANMRMIDARPSTTEHARIFDNNSAKQVLRWALLGDVIPTSGGFTDNYRATIVIADKTIRLVGIGLTLLPPVIRSGEEGALRVHLIGDRNLIDTEIPVSINFPNNEFRLLQNSVETREGDDVSSQRDVVVRFKAPKEGGVYSIRISLPQLDSLEELLLVTE